MILRRLLGGIRRKTVDALNLDRMSEKYHVLIINYIFFMLYTTLESVFVNTLLYTVSSDISIVIFYRAVVYFVTAVTIHIAAYIGKKKSPTLVIRLGAALYFLTYIALFFGLSHMKQLMFFVATLSGAGSGFYWSGHNTLVVYYTRKDNRDTGIAILGIIQGIMTLLVPVVSGYVITAMGGINGYRTMFGVGMAAVAIQIYVLAKLYPVEQAKHISQAKLALKFIRRKLTVKLMMFYEIIRGFRDGAFAFIMNMLLFEIITSESLVGINTFLNGAAAIIGSWVYGRFVKPHMRSQISFIAVAILTATCFPLFAAMVPWTVMSFSTVSSFLTLFILYSISNSTFDVVSQNETMRECLSEMMAFREGAIAFGRLLGLAVLLFLPHDQKGYVISILTLTASQFIAVGLMHLTQKLLERKNSGESALKTGDVQ